MTKAPEQRRLIPLGALGPQQTPNGAIIQSLHRGPDGYIPLAAKRDGEWTELGAAPVAQPFIPELLGHLALDGYFALNTSFGTGKRQVGTRKVWKPLPAHHPEFGAAGLDFPGAKEQVEVPRYSSTHPTTGLPFQRHTSNALRWLNVCHVDIDCYNKGLLVGDALGAIINLQDAGTIPPATMFARSGRGLWAFWFLVDADNPASGTRTLYNAQHGPHTPQRAHGRAIALYARVQRALADRLAHLGADIGALDGCRFAPVPGTLKTATETRVEYWVQGAHGQGFAYTLRGLTEALALVTKDHEHPAIEAALSMDRPEKHAGLSAAGKKGWLAKYRYFLADMEVLLRLRGGGFHLNRHKSLYLYATILRRNRMSISDVESRVIAAARASRPDATGGRLTDTEARQAVRSAFNGQAIPLSAHQLYLDFKVNDTEATYLAHIRPPHPAAPVPARRRTTAERYEAIREIIEQLGGVPPSTRVMAGYVQARGFEANFTTIARDYKHLGYTPSKPAGRPKKHSLF